MIENVKLYQQTTGWTDEDFGLRNAPIKIGTGRGRIDEASPVPTIVGK